MVFAGLGNTNKSATSLPSYLQAIVLSSLRFLLLRPSFYLALLGRNNSLSPPLSGYNGSLSSQPLSHVVSLSYLSYPLLSHQMSLTVSSKFFNTQIPSVSTKKLVLPLHAPCNLSRLRCNGRECLVQHRRDYVIILLRILCTIRPVAIPFLSMTCGPGLGELPASGA